jgi:hypothetical protein
MLQGAVKITTSLGVERIFESSFSAAASPDSNILLVEDTVGFGHESRAVEAKPRFSLFVKLLS